MGERIMESDLNAKGHDDSTTEQLYEINNLRKWFTTRSEGFWENLLGKDRYLKAVDDVSFSIDKGEILGVAGQSGCGKSTLGELLLMLQEPTKGTIRFNGNDITDYGKSELKDFRKRAQIIFQDPYEALNPRFPVVRTVEEPLVIHNIGDDEERNARTLQALEEAGLRPPGKYLDRLPSELSGGERQRVCIARALISDPDFIVADEPVSMLDVSVRTGILKLFKSLQKERDLSLMYISHDLSTIHYLADRTMIMYLGKPVEIGKTSRVIGEPSHPYTKALVDAVPTPDPDQVRSGSDIRGEVPDPIDLPTGCRFEPMCPYATKECTQEEPDLRNVAKGQYSACYHPVNGRYPEK